jgi:hypothetical protein
MQSSMRRWALNLAALISAAVMLLALGMAVRSVFFNDYWQRGTITRDSLGVYTATAYSVNSGGGSIGWGIWKQNIGTRWNEALTFPWARRTTRVGPPREGVVGRFEWTEQDFPSAWAHQSWMGVPWWFIALLASVLPAWWVWRWRRKRKVARSRGFEVVAG